MSTETERRFPTVNEINTAFMDACGLDWRGNMILDVTIKLRKMELPSVTVTYGLWSDEDGIQRIVDHVATYTLVPEEETP